MINRIGKVLTAAVLAFGTLNGYSEGKDIDGKRVRHSFRYENRIENDVLRPNAAYLTEVKERFAQLPQTKEEYDAFAAQRQEELKGYYNPPIKKDAFLFCSNPRSRVRSFDYLDEKVKESDVVLLGEYGHSRPEIARRIGKFLKPHLNEKTAFIHESLYLGFEDFYSGMKKDGKIFDFFPEFLRRNFGREGVVSDSESTLETYALFRDVVFPSRAMLVTAEPGLDYAARVGDLSRSEGDVVLLYDQLVMEDRIYAERICQALEKRSKVFVYIGSAHIASNNIPRYLDEISGGKIKHTEISFAVNNKRFTESNYLINSISEAGLIDVPLETFDFGHFIVIPEEDKI